MQLQTNKDIQRPVLFAFLRTERIFNFFFPPFPRDFSQRFFRAGADFKPLPRGFWLLSLGSQNDSSLCCPSSPSQESSSSWGSNFHPKRCFFGRFSPLFPAANRIQEGTGQPRSISGAGTGETGPSFPLGRTTCAQPGVSGFHSFFYSLFLFPRLLH